MGRIVASYVTCNSIDTIESSLNSVIDLVDFIVTVDGAYVGLPVPDDHSFDGTVDLVNSVVGKKGVLIQPEERLTEPQSRNLCLQFVQGRFPEGWMFWIDSDEVLHDARDEFKWLHKQENSRYQIIHLRRDDASAYRWYGYHLHTSLADRTPFHPRLYGGIPGLHFAENHWTLRDRSGDRVEPKYASYTLRNAWLEHRRGTRSRKNLDAINYYNTYERWKYERTIRPLKSYIPYPLERTTKDICYRGHIPAEHFLHFVFEHTWGGRTRD